ncbi:MAG TPA: 3-hydroxyacyl-CoA dehydrogenase NAD-binding domain-containing protein [Steroidobacteraceae bacterium]|nr:3-hydroxyacyl-CoA dehydrogenase NAD-binding domain-containing protein [Steroidobacteraceae bacterium]
MPERDRLAASSCAMRIGVLGSGLMGGKLGTLFARAGHDVLLLAVHWTRVDDVLKQAGSLSGKTVVSCTLPMSKDDSHLVVGHTKSGAEALPDLVYCGDNKAAKKKVATLIRDVGFNPVDVGSLSIARYIEPYSLLLAEIAYEGSNGPELAYRFEHLPKRSR